MRARSQKRGGQAGPELRLAQWVMYEPPEPSEPPGEPVGRWRRAGHFDPAGGRAAARARPVSGPPVAAAPRGRRRAAVAAMATEGWRGAAPVRQRRAAAAVRAAVHLASVALEAHRLGRAALPRTRTQKDGHTGWSASAAVLVRWRQAAGQAHLEARVLRTEHVRTATAAEPVSRPHVAARAWRRRPSIGRRRPSVAATKAAAVASAAAVAHGLRRTALEAVELRGEHVAPAVGARPVAGAHVFALARLWRATFEARHLAGEHLRHRGVASDAPVTGRTRFKFGQGTFALHFRHVQSPGRTSPRETSSDARAGERERERERERRRWSTSSRSRLSSRSRSAIGCAPEASPAETAPRDWACWAGFRARWG